MMRSGWVGIVVVVMLVRAAAAQGPAQTPVQLPGPPREPEVVIPDDGPCRTSWYIEPSLLLVLGSHHRLSAPIEGRSTTGAVLNRIAGGVELRFCDADASPSMRMHIGTTGYITNLGWIDHDDATGGVGLELEVTRPVASSLWLGGRLGIETAEDSIGLFTLGARLHVNHALWLGVDVFHRIPESGLRMNCSDVGVESCTSTTTGVMAGFGIEGRAGVITAAVESGLLGTAFVLLVLAFAGSSH